MQLSEVDFMLEAFKSVMASGPVAAILLVIVVKLWNKLSDVEDRCRKELTDKDKELKVQGDRTLRLAVRVQRCVEQLAGLKPMTIIDEDEKDEKLKSKDD